MQTNFIFKKKYHIFIWNTLYTLVRALFHNHLWILFIHFSGLKVETTTSSSIHFSWSGDNLSDVQICYYRLRLNYTDCSTSIEISDTWIQTETHFIATGLAPAWDYTLNVTGINCLGLEDSGECEASTQDDGK